VQRERLAALRAARVLEVSQGNLFASECAERSRHDADHRMSALPLVLLRVSHMNQQLQDFARQQIRDGLELMGPEQLRVFALMYGRKGGRRSVEDAVAMPMAEIVNEIPPEKLDWAMQQVANTLEKQPA
jgi:hypothetical protein